MIFALSFREPISAELPTWRSGFLNATIGVSRSFYSGRKIMKRSQLLSTIALALFACAGCGRSPETAIAQLTELEIGYTPANFMHYAREGKAEIVQLFLDAG